MIKKQINKMRGGLMTLFITLVDMLVFQMKKMAELLLKLNEQMAEEYKPNEEIKKLLKNIGFDL